MDQVDSISTDREISTPKGKSALRWPEIIFLGLPNQQKPGLLAWIVCALRMTFFGFGFATLLVLTGFKANDIGKALVWFGFTFFEELGRYSYLYKARGLRRASISFFLYIVVTETVSYWRPHRSLEAYALLRAPTIVIHLIATALMACAVRSPKYRIAIFAAIVAVHAGFDFFASKLTL